MTEWRRVYAVVEGGSSAAAAAFLTGPFHASLSHSLPSSRVNNAAVGSLLLVQRPKNAAVELGSTILRSRPDLSLPIVRGFRRFSN